MGQTTGRVQGGRARACQPRTMHGIWAGGSGAGEAVCARLVFVTLVTTSAPRTVASVLNLDGARTLSCLHLPSATLPAYVATFLLRKCTVVPNTKLLRDIRG